MFLTNRKKYRQNITKKKNAEEEEEMRKGRKKNIETKITRTNRLPSPKYPIDLHDRSSAELAEAID